MRTRATFKTDLQHKNHRCIFVLCCSCKVSNISIQRSCTAFNSTISGFAIKLHVKFRLNRFLFPQSSFLNIDPNLFILIFGKLSVLSSLSLEILLGWLVGSESKYLPFLHHLTRLMNHSVCPSIL